MKKLLLYLLLAFCFNKASAQTYVWTQKSDFGGGDRFAPFYFSIDDKGYVGCGVTFSGTTYQYTHRDFWEYNGALDLWTQMADFPDSCVSGASGFSIGTKGYVTTGWNPYQSKKTFEFDPGTNTWTQKSDFAGSARYAASSFSIGDFAYTGMGYTPLTNDFWKYDPATDAWTQIADIGGLPRQAASSFSLNGYGYVFGGTMALNDVTNELWQYDPLSNQWTQKAAMPGPGRYGAAAFSMNGLGFVGLGNDLSNIYSDFYCYNPTTDTWIQIASVPFNGRYEGFSFSFDNAGFIGGGTGSDVPTTNIFHDLWRLELLDANTITGKLFYDFNNNLSQDAGEPPLKNKLVSESTTGRISFSGPDGSYNLAVLTSGNFIITTDSFGYYSPVPSSHAISFAGINETDSLNDFAFQASTTINDLCVSISPLGNFRAGMDGSYVINYENSGTTILTPIITFFNDTNVVYVTSSVTPTVIATDSVVWDQLPALSPFQSGSLTVTVNVNQTVPIGTELDVSVRVDPITDDNNPLCNIAYWKQETTGSYDPNDILVNRKNIFVAELASQPYLDYTINFQNTGNDTAFNVDIINPFPPTLDLTSVEFVTSSHPVVLRYIADYHSLGFKFNNILLPDSNINEALSHGFIHYRAIPLTSLNIGDVIENSAAIYFDFNAPVLTNTVTTTVIDPLGVPLVIGSQQDVIMYPNPTNGDFKIKIKSNATEESLVEVYDLIGKKIISEKISLHDGINNLRFANYNLRTGIYLLKIKLKDKEFTQKLNIVK